jgi:hypothetical protein
MNSAANTPEPMPINSDDNQSALWDLVIEDFQRKYCGDETIKAEIIQLMKDRDEFGYSKYKVHLKIKNGRSFYNDLMAELLDAVVYSKGLTKEKNCFDKNLYNIYTDILKLLVYLYEYNKENNG